MDFLFSSVQLHYAINRHIFSAIAAGCLVLGLTACGGGLTADDAATFVLGDLDAAYKGEIRQEYLDLLTDTTEEDARQTYQDNIAIEAEYLLGYLETAYSSGGYYEDVYKRQAGRRPQGSPSGCAATRDHGPGGP